jgi:hypothetical protein
MFSDIITLAGLTFTLGGIIFYGGRIAQEIHDLRDRFDKANINGLDQRVTRLEAQFDLKYESCKNNS